MRPLVDLNWVVLKVTQLCNLNCSYCYVYNRGDESWRQRTKYLEPWVAATLSARINEQAEKHALHSFTVEFHGGEPLLLGLSRFRHLLETLTLSVTKVPLRLVLQTNGLLLNREWLKLFDRFGVSFSISVDGPPEVADRHRVTHDGRGSTQRLLDIVADLRQDPLFERLHSGTLCVIDPSTDGGEMVDWFMSNGFDGFDFLLPDGNYANPPEGWTGAEPYRDFLIQAFDRWFELDARAPRIRTFEYVLRGFMGGTVLLDSLGGDLGGLCVVETNGDVAASDVARLCGGRFASDELNIKTSPLDVHVTHYDLRSLQEPSETCKRCRYFENCGGGYLPHRYDGTSFDNPSLYCSALYALAAHAESKVKSVVPQAMWR